MNDEYKKVYVLWTWRNHQLVNRNPVKHPAKVYAGNFQDNNNQNSMVVKYAGNVAMWMSQCNVVMSYDLVRQFYSVYLTINKSSFSSMHDNFGKTTNSYHTLLSFRSGLGRHYLSSQDSPVLPLPMLDCISLFGAFKSPHFHTTRIYQDTCKASFYSGLNMYNVANPSPYGQAYWWVFIISGFKRATLNVRLTPSSLRKSSWHSSPCLTMATPNFTTSIKHIFLMCWLPSSYNEANMIKEFPWRHGISPLIQWIFL